MSTYIHKGSFRNPIERSYLDGRPNCDRALKKLFAAGPTTPPTLMKQDRSDMTLHAAMAKKLSRQERLRRSNAAEALAEVRKVHRAGGRRTLDEAEGDAPFISKSVTAMAKARQHAVPITENSLPNPQELNKLFADQTREIDVDNIERYRGHATGFRALSKAERRARKGFDGPHPIPVNGANSLNSHWTTARRTLERPATGGINLSLLIGRQSLAHRTRPHRDAYS